MKRKSTIKKIPAKKKVKEDKSQRNLEFYFNKQIKPTNETSSKKLEKTSNNPPIGQIETTDLTNAAYEDNLESIITENVSVEELGATIDQPEALITDTSQNSKKSGITSIFNDNIIQSNSVTLNSNIVASSSSSEM